MKSGEQQAKEIATIKERNITLNLSDADVESIAKYAGKANLTVGELLENFIGDLVDGTYTNGSDERDLADRWYNRSVALIPKDTLLRYLLEYGYDVDDFLTVYDEMMLYEENPTLYEKELMENGSPVTYPLWFYEEYKDYTDDFIEQQEEKPDMEKEVNLCRKWQKEFEMLSK